MAQQDPAPTQGLDPTALRDLIKDLEEDNADLQGTLRQRDCRIAYLEDQLGLRRDLERQIELRDQQIVQLEDQLAQADRINAGKDRYCTQLEQRATLPSIPPGYQLIPTELPPHVRMAVSLIRRELHSYPDQASRWRIAAILDELDPPAPTDTPVVGTIGDVKQALHDLEPASNQRGFDPDDPDRPF